MFIRKTTSGLYICRRAGRRTGRKWKKTTFLSHFLIKNQSNNRKNNSGHLNLGNVSFPKEMIGKRIRLKVEVVE